jgi:hypothetical protein
MAKFCIFCGCPPVNKNKEHIVPHWLIKLTGDPNRKAWFGFSFNTKTPTKEWEFAFDQFTFPACEKCNEKYSALESEAKKVIETILQDGAINSTEATTVLDWFDKVRVGLWLGFHQLDKNPMYVEPNFHIERRIGQYDRVLIVEKTDYQGERLNFLGANTPAFSLTPSAFSLTINQYCFTNISFNFLFARRAGFPYPDRLEMLPDRNEFLCNIMPARSRIMTPLIQRCARALGSIIYQPMYPQGLSSEKSAEYESQFVRAQSIDFERGIGKILFEKEGEQLRWLEPDESFCLTPKSIQGSHQQHIKSVINILEWQNWLNDGHVSIGRLGSEERKFIRKVQNTAKRINMMLIDNSRNILKNVGTASDLY